MTTLIDHIKADREAGTLGLWEYFTFEGVAGVTGEVRDIAHCSGFNTICSESEEEANARRIARVPTLEAALLAADELADAVEYLINVSDGVYGLHLNGDPAPWSDLTEGGRFEEWLAPLAAYRKAAGAEQ